MISGLSALYGVSLVAAPITTVPSITILTGQFGTLGEKRKQDIAQQLRELCGTVGESCQVFCSETSFGLYRLGRRPICRVVYRCPDGATRSVEAAREEPIMMRCETAAIEQDAAPAQEQLQPPPYIPPSGH